jgi:hypothetical protein
LALTAYVIVLASLPFQIPINAHFLRAAASTVAVSYAIKAFELARGRVTDASILGNFWRFLLWMIVPHDPRWRKDAHQRARNRDLGLQRVGRAASKAGAFLAIATMGPILHSDSWPYLVSATVTAFHFYFFATAITDAVGALALLFGCDIDELFRLPFAARSPADFWSRRWNVYIARFGARYIFAPLRARGFTLATSAVFAASAIMHEYIVLAIFGPASAKLGYMTLFFWLQCVGVLVQHLWVRKVRRRWRVREELRVVLHLLWFVPTTVLFFEPVGVFLRDWGILWRPLPW